MNIIKDLWRDFIDREGQTLRDTIKAKHGFIITPENARCYYRVGDDKGLIQIRRGFGPQYTTVGELSTDYSEPCLKYKIYDTL